MRMLAAAVTAILIIMITCCPPARALDAITDAHGVSLYGPAKYPADFTHFDYTNPDAPKGGAVKLGDFGSFDTLNPFVIRGEAAAGIGMIYETLMASSSDEPFSKYGLIAQTISIPADRSSVSFTLNPKARWHDGQPIKVEDVIWSFNTLKEKGLPFYRTYYAEVAKVEQTGPASVTFTFTKSGNTELPLIMSDLTVLPKHYWVTRDFSATTLEPRWAAALIRSAMSNRPIHHL